jgi:hypothetical protein
LSRGRLGFVCASGMLVFVERAWAALPNINIVIVSINLGGALRVFNELMPPARSTIELF